MMIDHEELKDFIVRNFDTMKTTTTNPYPV